MQGFFPIFFNTTPLIKKTNWNISTIISMQFGHFALHSNFTRQAKGDSSVKKVLATRDQHLYPNWIQKKQNWTRQPKRVVTSPVAYKPIISCPAMVCPDCMGNGNSLHKKRSGVFMSILLDGNIPSAGSGSGAFIEEAFILSLTAHSSCSSSVMSHNWRASVPSPMH